MVRRYVKFEEVLWVPAPKLILHARYHGDPIKEFDTVPGNSVKMS